jgi:hypothetical protein
MKHISEEFADYPLHLTFDPAHDHDHRSKENHTEQLNKKDGEVHIT